MLDVLVEKMGMEPWFATYVSLTVLIFAARIPDVLFPVIKREKLPKLFEGIKTYNPIAFYTLETVNSATENQMVVSKWRFILYNELTSKRK